jgi:hypothetical protein
MFFISLVPSTLLAAEREKSPVSERGGAIRAGAFVSFSTRTVVRFDSNDLPIGFYFDEDYLGFQTATVQPRVEFAYRFNKRHMIDAEYYSVKRTGTRSVDILTLDLEDPTLNVETVQLQTSFQTLILRVSYTWIFHSDNRVLLGLSPGVYLTDFRIRIKTLEPSELIDESSRLLIPLPVLGFRLNYQLTQRLGIISGYNTFFIKYQEFTGLMTEASLYFEHRTFKHLGFGAGATIFPMYITYEGERFTTEIRNTYLGAVLYASLYF